jgi:Chromosome segregation ATPases
MEFMLGNVFVCTSGDVAKRVTFCPEIRKKSITLDGEVYDHSGKKLYILQMYLERFDI